MLEGERPSGVEGQGARAPPFFGVCQPGMRPTARTLRSKSLEKSIGAGETTRDVPARDRPVLARNHAGSQPNLSFRPQVTGYHGQRMPRTVSQSATAGFWQLLHGWNSNMRGDGLAVRLVTGSDLMETDQATSVAPAIARFRLDACRPAGPHLKG